MGFPGPRPPFFLPAQHCPSAQHAFAGGFLFLPRHSGFGCPRRPQATATHTGALFSGPHTQYRAPGSRVSSPPSDLPVLRLLVAQPPGTAVHPRPGPHPGMKEIVSSVPPEPPGGSLGNRFSLAFLMPLGTRELTRELALWDFRLVGVALA